MDSKKLEFAHGVTRIISHISKMVFNLESENDIKKVFGIDQGELEKIIQRIVEALPPPIFNLPEAKQDEIKHIFAREFIFFQVQERGDDVKYEDDLSTFITVFSRDITHQLDVKQMVDRG